MNITYSDSRNYSVVVYIPNTNGRGSNSIFHFQIYGNRNGGMWTQSVAVGPSFFCQTCVLDISQYFTDLVDVGLVTKLRVYPDLSATDLVGFNYIQLEQIFYTHPTSGTWDIVISQGLCTGLTLRYHPIFNYTTDISNWNFPECQEYTNVK